MVIVESQFKETLLLEGEGSPQRESRALGRREKAPNGEWGQCGTTGE